MGTVSDSELEPNGRLVGYGTPGVFVRHTADGSGLCECLDFLTPLETSAWQRCRRPGFARVFGGEYAVPAFNVGTLVCWRHLRELGDSGLLDVRPLVEATEE